MSNQWVLMKKEEIVDKITGVMESFEIPVGFFGNDQAAAFAARIFCPNSYASLR